MTKMIQPEKTSLTTTLKCIQNLIYVIVLRAIIYIFATIRT